MQRAHIRLFFVCFFATTSIVIMASQSTVPFTAERANSTFADYLPTKQRSFEGNSVLSPEEKMIQFVKSGNIVNLQGLILANNRLNINYTDTDHFTALQYALFRGDGAMARFLISFGADPNKFTYSVHAPLRLAVNNNDNETAEIILKADGIQSINVISNMQTVLDLAIHKKNYTIINSLKQHKGRCLFEILRKIANL